MSHAVAGAEHQPPLDVKSWRAAVAICYEIVYPELVRESAKNADVLITISNDTWFGRSIGPMQHMEMARMRALENGRWLLRATNDGVTAIVDARGNVVKSLPRFEPGVLTGDFSVMTGSTPFARFGTLPVVVLLAALSFVGRTRRG
jgi:apolipoprotein N-acyltransferase